MKTKAKRKLNPKPKREDFDRVLTALLNTSPVTRAEVHEETSRKRHKKLAKVLGPEVSNHH